MLIQTSAELLWSLSSWYKIPNASGIKFDMFLKKQASHENGPWKRKKMELFYTLNMKLSVGLLGVHGWDWWSRDGVISPSSSAEHLNDIDTTAVKPQHLFMQKNHSSPGWAVLIGNIVQLWPWNQDLA